MCQAKSKPKAKPQEEDRETEEEDEEEEAMLETDIVPSVVRVYTMNVRAACSVVGITEGQGGLDAVGAEVVVERDGLADCLPLRPHWRIAVRFIHVELSDWRAVATFS